MQLLVLDNNFVFYKLQDTGNFDFCKILTINLAKYSTVKQLVSQLKPFETIAMTDRTLTANKKVVNIFSGNIYELWSEYGEDIAGQC